jgi:hypothetical protein
MGLKQRKYSQETHMQPTWSKKGGAAPSTHSRRARVGNWWIYLLGLVLTLLVGSWVIWMSLVSWAGIRAARTIVIVSEVDRGEGDAPVLILTWLPQVSQGEVVQIAPELPITTAGGYGEYQASKLWPLFSLDRSPNEATALLSLSLGRVIDEVFVLPHAQDEPLVTRFRSQALAAVRKGDWPAARALLGWWLVTRQQAIDHSPIKVQTKEGWARWQQTVPLHHPERSECPIALINTTGVSGLATRVAKTIEGSGGVVIRTADAPATTSETKIYTATPRLGEICHSTVSAWLQHILPAGTKTEVSEKQIEQYRATLVVELASDSADLLVGVR